MHPNCAIEIANAIGRAPSKAELDEIEAGLLYHLRDLARTDPRWSSMTGAQRMQAAAALASEAKLADARKTAERKASNLLAQARESTRMNERAATLAAQGRSKPHHAALFERMRQADQYVAGVRNEFLNELIPALHAIDAKFLGLFDDPNQLRQFAAAVLDGDTSNPKMAKAASVYIDAMEKIRARANANGADIGKLDYGYLPQPHDTGAIARRGAEQWISDVFPLLARDRYVDASGALMDDQEIRSLLQSAWTTLATEGRSKLTPGVRGGGSRASRFDDKHRVLHFKDADSYLTYNETYGRGSVLAAIHGHVGGMAKNIGLLEEFGANPASTYRLLKDLAEKSDNASGVHESAASLDMVWDTLNGTTATPVNARLASIFQGLRNFTTAAKLQGVMLSALTDAPMQLVVAKSNGIPLGDAMKSLVIGFGGDARRTAQDLALGMDEIAGEMARWHQDHLAQGWTAKLAQTTMKLTLVEGWTNALRRGFGLTLSGTLDRMRKTDWSSLDEFDRRRFEASGIDEATWKIWQAAPDLGDGMLSKNSIREVQGYDAGTIDRAVAKFLGYVDQESQLAVFSPDLHTRAMIQQGTRAGTPGGEALRSVMLFKSFAFGTVMKHTRRIQEIPTGAGKAAYGVSMLSSLTLFGAAVIQLKDMISGKDPRDMTTPKFWTAAFLQGGGLGIFGDILYTSMGGNARGGQANWTNLFGPILGTAFDAANIARKGAGWVTASEGDAEEARRMFGADVLRFTKGNTPFVNLWYLRSAVDHMLVHDMQEQLSPGYLNRMRKNAHKEWDQEFWWEPGDSTPERAPDLGAAVGQE